MVLLSLIQNHKGLVEEFKGKVDEMSRKVPKNEKSLKQTLEPIEDIEKVYSHLVYYHLSFRRQLRDSSVLNHLTRESFRMLITDFKSIRRKP